MGSPNYCRGREREVCWEEATAKKAGVESQVAHAEECCASGREERWAPARARLPQASAVLAKVRLVGDQQLVHILPRILVNLGEPPLDVVERLHVGDVIHDDDAVGAAVIGAANRAETLLARRIPDLKLYRLPVKLYGPDLEVDANGGDVAVCPLVILGERGRDSACCRKGRATRREQQTPPMAVERERRTAKRSSKHDFPTPESPMSTRMKR